MLLQYTNSSYYLSNCSRNLILFYRSYIFWRFVWGYFNYSFYGMFNYYTFMCYNDQIAPMYSGIFTNYIHSSISNLYILLYFLSILFCVMYYKFIDSNYMYALHQIYFSSGIITLYNHTYLFNNRCNFYNIITIHIFTWSLWLPYNYNFIIL